LYLIAGVQKELNSNKNQARRVEGARAQNSQKQGVQKPSKGEGFLHEHEHEILPSLFQS
jgi:hypothetical protein